MHEESEDQPHNGDRVPAPPLGLAGVDDEPGEPHIVRGID